MNSSAGMARTDRLLELERDLEVMHLRTAVSRVVTRDVSQWVDDDDASLDAIVDDVARRWQAHGNGDPTMLDGPGGFWNRYADRVEWAPPESGHQYRIEFCPAEDDPFDEDAYFHSVWRAHIVELLSTVPSGGR
jgi:hypothetical protein